MEDSYSVRVTKVWYSVEPEDVDYLETDDEEKVAEEIERIKGSLPQTFDFMFVCEEDELEDYIADEITDETGWLVESFEYEIVGK